MRIQVSPDKKDYSESRRKFGETNTIIGRTSYM